MALFFTALLGGAGAILGYFIYTFSDESFILETERAIDTDIATVVGLIDAGLGEEITMVLEAHRLPEQVHTFFIVLDGQGERLYGTLLSLPPEIALIQEGIVQFRLRAENLPEGYPYANAVVAAKVEYLDDGSRLVVAREIGAALESRERMRALAILTIVLMATVILTSFFISTFVVARINRIGRTARRIIETGDLSQRISIESRWDDLSNLAVILNELLTKIEKLMLNVRQVSDNIAHDLRTPLTRMRGRLESLEKQAAARGDEASLEQVDQLIWEADHLLNTFAALLRIANIESGKQSMPVERLDLADLAQDVEELYGPLAEEKQIELRTQSAAVTCIGDRDLLFQVVANLVDNAVKFTPEGGRIDLTIRREPVHALISIADNGPGIPEEERARVFNRFYRVDSSRSAAGNGLGLSLVAAVIERHRGTITLSDNHPGLRVDVRLPLPLTDM